MIVERGACPWCGRVPGECSFETRWQFSRAVLCECGATGPKVELIDHDYRKTEAEAWHRWNVRSIAVLVNAGVPASEQGVRMIAPGMRGVECPSCHASHDEIEFVNSDTGVRFRCSRCLYVWRPKP